MVPNIKLTVNITHECGGKIALPATELDQPYVCPLCGHTDRIEPQKLIALLDDIAATDQEMRRRLNTRWRRLACCSGTCPIAVSRGVQMAEVVDAIIVELIAPRQRIYCWPERRHKSGRRQHCRVEAHGCGVEAGRRYAEDAGSTRGHVVLLTDRKQTKPSRR